MIRCKGGRESFTFNTVIEIQLNVEGNPVVDKEDQ